MAYTLRLTQTAEREAKYRIDLSFEGAGLSCRNATACFDFIFTRRDQEDFRWYFEDYPQWPLDPAPNIAARIENRMTQTGTGLFKHIFQANHESRQLWSLASERLSETRVEIVTEARDAAAIPWELMREPDCARPLSVLARSFVYVPAESSKPSEFTA